MSNIQVRWACPISKGGGHVPYPRGLGMSHTQKWVPGPRPIPMNASRKKGPQMGPKWAPNKSRGKIGLILGPKWDPFGDPFLFGAHLGPIWGPILRDDHFIWGPFGTHFVWGPFGACLGPILPSLGPILGPILIWGPFWGRPYFGLILAVFWPYFGELILLGLE